MSTREETWQRMRQTYSPAFLAKFNPSVLARPREGHFPATVSYAAADGSLTITVLYSREEADAAGFPWVGH
jgi:hypothetical protein